MQSFSKPTEIILKGWRVGTIKNLYLDTKNTDTEKTGRRRSAPNRRRLFPLTPLYRSPSELQNKPKCSIFLFRNSADVDNFLRGGPFADGQTGQSAGRPWRTLQSTGLLQSTGPGPLGWHSTLLADPPSPVADPPFHWPTL